MLCPFFPSFRTAVCLNFTFSKVPATFVTDQAESTGSGNFKFVTELSGDPGTVVFIKV